MTKTYADMIAKELRADGWRYGELAHLDEQGRLTYAVDVHKDGHKCVARAETLLTAYVELQKLTGKASTSSAGTHSE